MPSGDEAGVSPGAKVANRGLILATATSLWDSGLLDTLLPAFHRSSSYRVTPVAVGTGEALAMGRRGDADVILAHAPSLEKQSVADGFTINRRPVMHNDFLVVGPAEDPAGIRGGHDASESLLMIVASGAVFVSRGDASGTHFREQELWQAAGISPAGDRYLETGQGMGATLMIASQRRAYTLTDRGTYLAFKERIELEPMTTGRPAMLNLYSVMETNPARFEQVDNAGARAFADFLLGDEAQSLIRSYGVDRFGEPLFFPDGGREEDDLDGS